MKVLLAVDSSSASDLAIQEAAERPWPAGTTLDVISVVEPWDAPPLVEGLRRSASELLEKAAAKLKSTGLPVCTELLSGDPKSEIVDRAAEIKADWIMVGSRGTTGINRFLLGSVALGVARFAPCSVEIVRPRVRDEDCPGAIRILLATDGSPCSELAAHSIAGRPWPKGSEVHVLSVVELSVPLLRMPPAYFDSHAMQELRGAAMKRTEEAEMWAEQILSDAGMTVSGTVAVPCATPKELILEEAQRWGADLIVLGSHGRRGISRFLLGSVSEAVAAHAHCSVEIVRHV